MAADNSAGGIGNMLSTGSSVYDAISGSAGSMYGNFATSGIGSALGLSTGLSTSSVWLAGLGQLWVDRQRSQPLKPPKRARWG